LRPTIPSNLSPELKDLIERLWDKDPDKRPSTAEILDILWNMKVLSLSLFVFLLFIVVVVVVVDSFKFYNRTNRQVVIM
jgi:serine/threonine protein kinase